MRQSSIVKINDFIHGTILISSLEKHVISTQAFNRLHNILQNSTVYLTFPSNQTKRFAHSLGVMHLGGEIFRYSIINAAEEIRNEFFDAINKEVEILASDRNFIDKLRLDIGDEQVNLIRNFKEFTLEDPMYSLITPKVIKNEYLFAYILTFQAIRIVALLHDIGHPPFSHITEFALKDIWKAVRTKKIKTPRQQDFLKALPYNDDEEIDLHEQIGNKIAYRLTNNIISETDKLCPQQRLFYWLVHLFVVNILEENGKIYEDIHRIVASSIDCDRLDYVTRDVLSSGVTAGHIEYDRLLTSMKLIKNGNDFIFCPDIKSVNTIEDFFNRRWNLYKDIIYHHRVVKTDYLLGKIISELALDYLSNDDPDTTQEKNELPLDISGLWRAIKEVNSNSDYFNAIIQWDDAWLLAVLRQQYFKKYCNHEKNVKYQLEELLSNKKHYRSMVKKMEAFLEIDKSVVENFDVDISDIEKGIGESFKPFLAQLKRIMNNYKDSSWKDKAPDVGFFLDQLKTALEILSIHNEFQEIIQESVEKVAYDQYNVKDCLVVFKKLKTGMEKNFPFIYKGDEAELLNRYSRIDADLRIKKTVFPVFFIYVIENQKIENHNGFLQSMGKEIAKNLKEFINQKFILNHSNSDILIKK